MRARQRTLASLPEFVGFVYRNYDDRHVCVCDFFSNFFRLTAFSFCFFALVCRSTYGRNDRLLHRTANHNRIQHETQKVDREQSKEERKPETMPKTIQTRTHRFHGLPIARVWSSLFPFFPKLFMENGDRDYRRWTAVITVSAHRTIIEFAVIIWIDCRSVIFGAFHHHRWHVPLWNCGSRSSLASMWPTHCSWPALAICVDCPSNFVLYMFT